MTNEKDIRKPTYEKANATVVRFDNSDVITTSGGSGVGCSINVFSSGGGARCDGNW